jgi:prepilin peptidase CpaA
MRLKPVIHIFLTATRPVSTPPPSMNVFNASSPQSFAIDPLTVTLCALLIVAAVIDYRSHRIPNWLTAGGALIALVSQAFGSIALATPPSPGFLGSLSGLALGLAILLPLYVLRVTGAGDVKLMAMVGAYLGFWQTLPALLFVFVAGGVAAIFVALAQHAFVRMLHNALDALVGIVLLAGAGVRPDTRLSTGRSVGRLPFAVCICAGTLAYLAVREWHRI